MREKIALLFLEFGNACFSQGSINEWDYADQILALFISNPFWKDIDRNLPSLEGIVVVNECKHHDSLGRNIINRTAKYPCCNGTGTITRQAEWRDLKIHTEAATEGLFVIVPKSGGRLRVKK